jgi:adenylate cyclase
LNDVFAIETEVAQSIAKRLRAKVSARERAALDERPTRDLVAYDLYVRATPLIEQAGMPDLDASLESKQSTLLQCIDLLNQAISRDPAFLLAYCWLARAHDTLYFEGIDLSSSRLDLANAAIQSAFRLRPDSGDAHVALALHLYWGYFDYDHARAELAEAQRTLPNNSRVFELLGLIDRRQGRWSAAVRNFQRAPTGSAKRQNSRDACDDLFHIARLPAGERHDGSDPRPSTKRHPDKVEPRLG